MFAVAATVAGLATLSKGVAAIPCSTTCYYELTADMTWTGERHPTDYPAGGNPNDMPPAAFFPNFWTVAHDSSFYIWREGNLANAGIQEIAEAGSGEAFMEEVEECGASCGEGEGFPCDPMSGSCSASGLVKLVESYPYLSVASMLAPSPDWFTGIDSWNLCVDGEWVEYMSEEVFPYDAGTDSGPTFASPDEVTTPQETIFSFLDIEPESDNIFYNPTEGTTLSIGTIGVTLVQCEGMDVMADMAMAGAYGAYGAGEYGEYGAGEYGYGM